MKVRGDGSSVNVWEQAPSEAWEGVKEGAGPPATPEEIQRGAVPQTWGLEEEESGMQDQKGNHWKPELSLT